MPQVLRIIAEVLPVLPVTLILVAGAWGGRRLLGAPTRTRPDRMVAVVIAVLVALVAGALLTVVVVGFATMDTGPRPEAYAAAVPFGIVAGIATFLASIAGYAVLARPAVGGLALGGALLGPALFVGAQLGAFQLSLQAQYVASEAEATAEASQVAARSSILHLAISNVGATTAQGGRVVASVGLRATVHADSEVRLATGKIRWPRFAFLLEDGGILDTEAPAGAPGVLGAGSDAVYDLTFQVPEALLNAGSGTFRAPPPGLWVFRMELVDEKGMDYEVETKVQVGAAP